MTANPAPPTEMDPDVRRCSRQDCSKEAAPGRLRCASCLERDRQRRVAKRALGKCRSCPELARPGLAMCAACAKRQTAYGRKHRTIQPPEYLVWSKMKGRCSNPRDTMYQYYGLLGVTVCERWRASFSAFMADMGPRPSDKHSIDRIDSAGNYEPGNCRWATTKEQHANRRSSAEVQRLIAEARARQGGHDVHG